MKLAKIGVILCIVIAALFLARSAAGISGSTDNSENASIDLESVSFNGSDGNVNARAEGGDIAGIATGSVFGRLSILNMTLDVPVFVSVLELEHDGGNINSTNPVITGENFSIRTNITSANPLSSVILQVWRGNKNSGLVIESPLTSGDGLYNLTLKGNYTYPAGSFNYTLVANTSIGTSGSAEGVIEVEYNATLNVSNDKSVEYGSNFSIIAVYNLTNTSLIAGAGCNVTLGTNASDVQNLSAGSGQYNGSINSSRFSLGSNTLQWACGREFHSERRANTTLIVSDTALPVISNIVASPDTPNVDDNIVFNATVTDGFLRAVWIEINYTGLFVNQTNISGAVVRNGDVYSFTLGAGNLTSNLIIEYQWFANDTSSNIRAGGLYRMNVTNRLPGTPTLGNPRDNEQLIFDNTTLLNWNSSDVDRDSLLYHFQLANDSGFGASSLVVNTTINETPRTIANTGNYSFTPTQDSTGLYYWRVRVKDNANFTNFSEVRSFNLQYAYLNITTPAYDVVLNASNITIVTAAEIINGGWITSVNLTIMLGSTNTSVIMEAVDGEAITSYTYNYTIADTNSTLVEFIAVGSNGSRTSNASSRIRVNPKLPLRTAAIESFCANQSVITSGTTQNVTFKFNLGRLVNFVNVSMEYPNGTLAILVDYANNSVAYREHNYSYVYNYSFLFSVNGTYMMRAEARDIDYPSSSALLRVGNLSVAGQVTLNLTMTGLNAMVMRDTCSGQTLASGTSITSAFPQGVYDLVLTTNNSKQVVELYQANLTGASYQVCNFTDIDETVTPPGNFRAVDQFDLSCNNALNFSTVNLTYNYNTIISSILTEGALKVYRCEDRANNTCTWTLMSASLFQNNNNITAGFSNFSTFMLGEDISLVQLPTLPPKTQEGGGSGPKPGETLVVLDILQPGKITMYTNESITAPVHVRNNGNVTLEDIDLTATTDSDAVAASLDTSHIDSLGAGEEQEISLTITSLLPKPGTYEVNVEARIGSPRVVSDSAIFFIDLIAYEEEIVRVAEQQLEFLARLFSEHPDCKEYEESAEKARESFAIGNYEKALAYSDAALQACKGLIQGKEQFVDFIELEKLDVNDIFLIGIQLLVVLFLFAVFHAYYKRRKFRIDGSNKGVEGANRRMEATNRRMGATNKEGNNKL